MVSYCAFAEGLVKMFSKLKINFTSSFTHLERELSAPP